MKLGSPVLITSHPFTAPRATATVNAHRMDSHIGQPHCTDRIAMTMPAKPIMEPTERSNSPAIISRQAPAAMIANWAETTPQFIAPSAENIPVSDATSRKKTKTRMVPQMEPSSGRTSALRSGDISLTRSSRGGAPGAFRGV